MTALWSWFLFRAGTFFEVLIFSLSSYLLSLPNLPLTFTDDWKALLRNGLIFNISSSWPLSSTLLAASQRPSSSGRSICHFQLSGLTLQYLIFLPTQSQGSAWLLNPWSSSWDFPACLPIPVSSSHTLVSLVLAPVLHPLPVLRWNFNTFIKYSLSKYSYPMMIW